MFAGNGEVRPHYQLMRERLDTLSREELGQKILAAIGEAPLYYTDIAERFSDYDFNTVARALGHLHKTEKLWQDSRGRMCVRGSKFAAVLPVKK